jgi:uncharacterized repeat protein (TIGR03803 family)
MKYLSSFAIVLFSLALAACGGAMNPSSQQMVPALGAARAHTSGISPAKYKLLYSFKGTPDGASPFSGLLAVNDILYGTTLNGSSNYCSQSCGDNDCYLGCGTVFSVDASGNEQVVYNFKGNFNSAQDGSWPFAGLTSSGGTLYGTTSGAGAHSYGTVYSITTSGSEKVIYSFKGGNDGIGPEAPLTAYDGKLYGTTVTGGGTGCGGSGCGTVFKIDASGKESVLYSFAGGNDGYRVFAGVTVLRGRLFGATLQGGGTGCGGDGCGTLFEINLQGKEKVLHRFAGSSDGEFPNGLVVENQLLYGTTEAGGTKNSGVVFVASPSGKFKTVYNFLDIPDGNGPGANMIYLRGYFYGTTIGGGTAGDGSVFRVSASGKERVMYSFLGGSDGSDPQGPVYTLNGELFGTTDKGGGTGCSGSGCGTIYKLSP